MKVKELLILLEGNPEAEVVMSEARREGRIGDRADFAEEVVGFRARPTRAVSGVFKRGDKIWLHD